MSETGSSQAGAAASSLMTAKADDARWSEVYARVVGVVEGGDRFTDDPQDRGGATKFGLSLRFLQELGSVDLNLLVGVGIGDRGVVTVADVAALTGRQAEAVYREAFWIKTSVCELPKPFDLALFDQAVNDGQATGVKLLQTAANAICRSLTHTAPLVVDGRLGEMSLIRIKTIDGMGLGAALLAQLKVLAAHRYRDIVANDPSQTPYLAGWLSRAAHLGDL